MTIEYVLLDENYVVRDNVERSIQRDIEWIQNNYPELKEDGQNILYLVDAKEFESSVSLTSRAIAVKFGTAKIYQTDGCILGTYSTDKPIEQMNLDELLVYSKEQSNTLLRSDMLTKLHQLATEKTNYK